MTALFGCNADNGEFGCGRRGAEKSATHDESGALQDVVRRLAKRGECGIGANSGVPRAGWRALPRLDGLAVQFGPRAPAALFSERFRTLRRATCSLIHQ